MSADHSVDPRRCWIHGLSRVQHFSTPTPSGTTAGGVSWWECPQCNLAAAMLPVPAAMAPPSAPPEPETFQEFAAKVFPDSRTMTREERAAFDASAYGPPETTAPTTTTWAGSWNNWIAPFHFCPRCKESLNWSQHRDSNDRIVASCCGVYFAAGLTGALPMRYASTRCTVPPKGWLCTRRGGHDGPCAVIVDEAVSPVASSATPTTCLDESERIRRLPFIAEYETLVGDVLRAERACAGGNTLTKNRALIDACYRLRDAYVGARASQQEVARLRACLREQPVCGCDECENYRRNLKPLTTEPR